MPGLTLTKLSMIACFSTALSASSLGVVPTYSVEVAATYTTTTTLRGASEAGHMVGDTVSVGLSLPFVATVADGLTLLPLPAGYVSGTALGVNASGVVVGAVTQVGTWDTSGEPVIWTPDGAGGYVVTIPQQFATVPGPLGTMSVDGGMAVAINEAGTVVGWSRFQGFQGGPTTLFSPTSAPVNLQPLGFDATVRAINNNGVISGGELVFDLNTNSVIADIGVPQPLQPGNVSFTQAIAYAINDSNEAVVAADLASVPTENWLTYVHNVSDGYIRLNPSQLPARFVGFYDNNNLGDVSASGGVLFRAEDVLVQGYTGLLDPIDSDWTPALGFICNDRRVYTTAVNASTGENALVVLVPDPAPCSGDLNGDGVIDTADLGLLIGGFGGSDSVIDLNGDGVVDTADLGLLIGEFGSACP